MSLLSGDVKVSVPHASWLKLLLVDWPRDACVWSWRSAVRHPKLWLTLVLLVALFAVAGRAAAYVAYLPLGLVPWRLAHPASFRRWVVAPLRADWRRTWRYERKWHDIMVLNHLGEVIDDGLDALPQIRKVRTHGYSRTWVWDWPPRRVVSCRDTVLVAPLIGQHPEDFQDVAERLARDVGARSCRVHEDRHNRLRLEFMHGPDPLADEIPALPIPASSADIDLKRIPVGLTETGEPWTIDVLLHLLIAGQTGSGKSGVLQGLLRGLAPMIRDGLVEVWGIDPKEAVEFGDVSALFKHFEAGTLQDFSKLLAAAVTACSDRGRRMAARRERMHVPTTEEPLVLIVIDELVDLTDLKSMVGEDKKTGQVIAASLTHLLRKGRAKGFIVIGALTDPSVDALPMRHHFPYRIGMRLDTARQTIMVLGEGARERGAFCESIPTALPGVGHAIHERDREAIRVRAAYVTDEDIAALVAEYAPQGAAVESGV